MENASKTTDLLSILVRLLGLVMLLIGLYVGVKVILEAWRLYDEPQRIERFADAIDHGSNLDDALKTITQGKLKIQPDTPSSNKDSLRISYFLAWFLAILLLMVVGSLAASAIRTGGQLALYDLQVKRFARQIVTEVRKQQD